MRGEPQVDGTRPDGPIVAEDGFACLNGVQQAGRSADDRESRSACDGPELSSGDRRLWVL